ncbi:MAG: triose-phosphate isomerase [Bacteroidia bacterium]
MWSNTCITHSERRTLFKEEDDVLLKKVKAAWRIIWKVIFCIGETKEQRKRDTLQCCGRTVEEYNTQAFSR